MDVVWMLSLAPGTALDQGSRTKEGQTIRGLLDDVREKCVGVPGRSCRDEVWRLSLPTDADTSSSLGLFPFLARKPPWSKASFSLRELVTAQWHHPVKHA